MLSYLDDPIVPLQVKALKDVAPSLGVTLHFILATRSLWSGGFDAYLVLSPR
jgi:hypothetical protein